MMYKIEIKTRDGLCPSFVFRPAGSGPWPAVRRGAIGTTGYCMGGFMSLTAAGTATDAADCPHLLAPRIKSRLDIAGAIEDQCFPDDMKNRLVEALTQAHIDATLRT